MDRPAKRRRLSWRGDKGLEKEDISVAERPTIKLFPAEKENLLDNQLPLHAATLKLPHLPIPFSRKDPLLSSREKIAKAQRLHPRKLNLYQDTGSEAEPEVQPVTTAVASFVNVVLESGGTSVGNVLVPAASSVFDLDGYGPVTINKNPASSPTPSSNPHRHSHAPQQTPQPAPSTARSQPTPLQQNPMSIQVPGSSSQVIISAPPTPLPPNPSESSSTSTTASESYFSSLSAQTTSSSQTSSSGTLPSQTKTIPSPSLTVPNGGSATTKGNFSTSLVTSSQTISGSTRVTTFPVLITPTANSNSTALSSSSSSFFGGFSTASNSLDPSSTAISPSSTLATSTRSSTTSLVSPSITSSSSSESASSSSASASGTNEGTGAVGGVGGPTSTAGGAPASSTTAAAASGGGSSPSTPALVGGVVGGVAGLALILVVILFYLRRRHRTMNQRNISPPNLQGTSTGIGPGGGSMTQRSSAAIPLAGAGFFRRLRPDSGATATTTETAPSERGFQNLGGRKLPSVLSSRGDGYGDIPFGSAGSPVVAGPSSSRGAAPPSIPIITAAPSGPGHASPESLSGSSFYRDSQGFYGGPGPGQAGTEQPSNSSSMVVGPASPPQSPTLPPSGGLQPAEGVAVMRPGPARTPVTTQGGLSPMRGPHARDSTINELPPPYTEDEAPTPKTEGRPSPNPETSVISSNLEGRRSLLLVYVHGFMGNETSFQKFPTHVHNLLCERLADQYAVQSIVYPKYKSRKKIDFARDELVHWLGCQAVDDADVILLGHSMGGLLVAEVALSVSEHQSEANSRYRIIGTINLDTPFLGMHPGIVVSGLSSLFRPTPEQSDSQEPSNQVQQLGHKTSLEPSSLLAPEASSASPNSSASTLHLSPSTPSINPDSNNAFQSDQHPAKQSTWEKAFYFLNKHSGDLTKATRAYFTSHLEFGGCLADPKGLMSRYSRIIALDEQARPNKVCFVNYYTASTGRPKKPKTPKVEERGAKPKSSDIETEKLEHEARSVEGETVDESLNRYPRKSSEDDQSHILTSAEEASQEAFDHALVSPDEQHPPDILDPPPVSISLQTTQASSADESSTMKPLSSPTQSADDLLPPLPSKPEEPPPFDPTSYTDKDILKIASRDHARLVKAYHRALKDRDKAIADRRKLLAKRAKDEERRSKNEAKKMKKSIGHG
ncbi:MAG: hypothetical protein Q9212_003746 [Teloschistes hypoglaucus]